MRSFLIWAALVLTLGLPVLAAAFSPFLAWRQPIYILAGFAGIVGLALMLLQPLLAMGALPGVNMMTARRIHRWIGAGLVLAVVVHVVGLWITSPPDVIDVLLMRSPTPFSIWGLLAMWAVILAATLALLRKALKLNPKLWRQAHIALAAVIVIGTVIHALQIEGAMEPVTKTILCLMVVVGFTKAVITLGAWKIRR